MAKAVLEHPVSVQESHLERNTRVGRYTYFRRGSTLVQGCEVGRYCAIARDVEIGMQEHRTDWLNIHTFQYDHDFFRNVPGYNDHARVKRAPLPPAIVGNDVWIGAKAIIRRGVRVGDGAIIGAGSFVNKDVPPYAIVAGTPAKLIRFRFSPDVIERLLDVQWWDLLPHEMDGVPFNDIEAALDMLEKIKERTARLEQVA